MKTKGSGFFPILFILACVLVSPLVAAAAVIAEQPIYDTEGEGGNYSLYQQVIGTGLTGQLASATFYLRPASINGAFNDDLVSLLECDRVQMDVGCATFFSESHKLVQGAAPSFETFDFFPIFTFNPAKYYSIQVVSPGGWPYGGNPPYQTHIFGSASSTFNGQPCMNCLNLSSIFFRLDDTYASEERIAAQTTATAAISQLGYAGYPTQSFTPTESGVIRSVAIAAACGVVVSDGQFATARFDGGQAIPGGNRFTGGAFPVTAGQTYYITYLCDEIFDVISGTATDSYPGGEAGQAFMPGTGDIHFASNASVGNTLLDWAFTVCTSINCTLTPSANTAPAIANLSQFREFGIDPIAPGAGFIGNAVVLKADVNDADSTQVTLEIEIKKADTPFDGTNLHATSSSVTPGVATTLAVDIVELISHVDQYASRNHQTFHWRARAVDAEGHASEWQEFASAASSFTANVVPLWTQVASQYPDTSEQWAGELYASGIDHVCGDKDDNYKATIGSCGCLLTSFVMIAHYNGINKDDEGNAITPLSMNNWLMAHGHIKNVTHNELNPVDTQDENIPDWFAILKYLGTTVDGKSHSWFDYATTNTGSIKFTNKGQIDDHLASAQPVIAYNTDAGHYFVITSKLSESPSDSAYVLRDPYFYNTRTLQESTSKSNQTHNYENIFANAVIPVKLQQPKLSITYPTLYLASPAEFLVIDSQGRRVGNDPRTGTTYNQIPGAVYDLWDPIVTSETGIEVGSLPHTKMLRLPPMDDGAYDVKVIGTGTGTYQFTFSVPDVNGDSVSRVFTASTTPNQVTDYQLVVSNGVPTISLDTIPPEAFVSFSTTTKSIVIAGTDDQSVPTVVTGATSSVITDASGNTLTLNLAQNVKQANYASLTIPSFHYSTGTTTLATTSLRYFWSTDKFGKYTLFISAVRTATGRQIAIYTSLLGKTYVVSSTLADDTANLSLQPSLLLLRSKTKTYTGLYVPGIETQKGSVLVR